MRLGDHGTLKMGATLRFRLESIMEWRTVLWFRKCLDEELIQHYEQVLFCRQLAGSCVPFRGVSVVVFPIVDERPLAHKYLENLFMAVVRPSYQEAISQAHYVKSSLALFLLFFRFSVLVEYLTLTSSPSYLVAIRARIAAHTID